MSLMLAWRPELTLLIHVASVTTAWLKSSVLGRSVLNPMPVVRLNIQCHHHCLYIKLHMWKVQELHAVHELEFGIAFVELLISSLYEN